MATKIIEKLIIYNTQHAKTSVFLFIY